MAKKNKNEEIHTSIDTLNESLTSMSDKIQKNRKMISIVCSVIAVIVAIILVYVFMIRKPAIVKADNTIALADYELIMNGNDSAALELYKTAATMGYDAGNRARLMAATILYREGEYEQALTYLNDYKAKEAIVGAGAYSLKGDCLVNLDRLDEAVVAFKDAVKKSDNNKMYTPFFMLKLARVYHAQGNYGEEAAELQKIVDEYPQFMNRSGVNVRRDLERARMME